VQTWRCILVSLAPRLRLGPGLLRRGRCVRFGGLVIALVAGFAVPASAGTWFAYVLTGGQQVVARLQTNINEAQSYSSNAKTCVNIYNQSNGRYVYNWQCENANVTASTPDSVTCDCQARIQNGAPGGNQNWLWGWANEV
jgi:hypothetical protein